LAEEINIPTKIAYHQIPGFPVSTVEGHAGQFVAGEIKGVPVLAMQGRFHYYEGYALVVVSLPLRVMKALVIESLVVTNAASGVYRTFTPGDLMLSTDHITNVVVNPLIGPNKSEFGVRFPDMSTAYTPHLQEMARAVAKDLGIPLQEGGDVWNSGPSYETPAEIQNVDNISGGAAGG